jgi:DnaJ-class molecular chaperone
VTDDEAAYAKGPETQPTPCAMCNGKGEYPVTFHFGVQMQDCAGCFGSGVEGDK